MPALRVAQTMLAPQPSFHSELQPEGISSDAISDVIVCSYVQPLNAFAPMVVTDALRTKSRLVQPSKAFAPIVLSPKGKFSSVSDEQLRKAPALIAEIPFLPFTTVTLSNAVQFANILS